MSVLTMVQNVADESQLFERPTEVIASSSKSERQSLSFLKKVCRELLSIHDWQALTKEQTFTSDGSGSYAFSSIVTDGDFERVKDYTEWDRTNQKKIRIVTAAEWQELESGIISQTGIYRYARVRGNNLIVTPDESGDSLVFEYISNYYAESSGGTAKTTFTDDTDTSLFPEYLLELGLKYYLKTEYGLPAQEDALRFYDEVDSLKSREMPSKVINMGYSKSRNDYVINIPDSGVGL